MANTKLWMDCICWHAVADVAEQIARIKAAMNAVKPLLRIKLNAAAREDVLATLTSMEADETGALDCYEAVMAGDTEEGVNAGAYADDAEELMYDLLATIGKARGKLEV